MQEHEKEIKCEDANCKKQVNRFSLSNQIPQDGNSCNPQKVSIKISAIYIIIGCICIAFSERIVKLIVSDMEKIMLFNMIKNWIFVIASGIIIYMLIYDAMKRIRKTEKEVIESYDELSATYEELEASYEEIASSEEAIKQQFDELQISSNLIMASEDRLKRAQALAKVGNWELNLQSKELWASEEAFRLYGIEHKTNNLPLEEAQRVVHKDDREKMNMALKLLLEKNEKYDMEFRISTLDDNTEKILHSVAELSFNSAGEPQKVLGVIHDITEGKINLETLKKLAYYDVLTDLPNRELFIERLKKAINSARNANTKIAVVFFDIDNFKKVNDLLGHNIGDKLLIDISNKLKSSLLDFESLARFSGDEFSLFIENVSQSEEITIIIKRIKEIFESLFNYENHSFQFCSSIGISIFPDHGESVEELLKNADTAMYKAKQLGSNNYQFYDNNLRDEISKKLKIEEFLRNAIKNDELYLCYQPQVSAKSCEIRGLEALIRWESAEIGMISPLEFIPIAEETGLIIPIGEWVLEKACKTIKALHESYNFNMIISVNISPVQLKQKNFSEKVKYILNKTGLEPELLELEITENVLIDSFDIIDTVNMLGELKKLGVKISLDDFGTGFSSLNYLTKLPISTLKIDKTFVDDIRTNSKQNTVTDSIISLMNKLELEVIAEGVETKEQLEYLIKSNCDTIQGFLFCKPLVESELKRVLEKGKIFIN